MAKQRCPLDLSQRTKATGVQLSIKGRGYGEKNGNHQSKDASLIKSRDLGQQYGKAETITCCLSIWDAPQLGDSLRRESG